MLNDVELTVYKDLTKIDDNKEASIQNFIESCEFFSNGKHFLNFLLKLKELNIDFKIVEGFKGRTQFIDKENYFINCVLLYNKDIINVISEFNDLKYSIDNDKNYIIISLSTNQ